MNGMVGETLILVRQERDLVKHQKPIPTQPCSIPACVPASERWKVWAFPAELHLRSGMRCLGREVHAAQKGAFAPAG
jgi:hypothetical protein